MNQVNKRENYCGYPMGEDGRKMLADMSHHHAPVTDWTLELLDIQPDEIVLEIGCGGGHALKRAACRITSGKLYGVDYSETAVLAAKEENAENIAGGSLTVIEASVSRLPFPDHTFDKVYSIESYFFWPDLEQDFKEILRVLNPGGKVYITGCVHWRDGLSEEEKAHLSSMNMRNLSFAEFGELLTAAGYQDVHIHGKEGREWICGEGTKAE